MSPVNASGPFLRLSGLSLSFGAYKALHDLSLDIGEGEFFSLLGPSGCGKTTTLRLIAGFEAPDRGNIWLAGDDITTLPPNLRDTNTVFQSYALFPHMTVRENVAYPLRMRGVAKAEIATRVDDAIAKVNLGAFAERLPHEMSGGQRQRAALARAIVGRPKILLLDEPLGALDLKLREQMQHVLVDLQKSLGITFIYVTHDQGEALSMSDRIAVMSGGLIQQIGTPEEIYYRPTNAFVADFIGKSNRISASPNPGDAASLRFGPVDIPRSRVASRTQPSAVALRFEALDVQPEGRCDVTFDARIARVMFLGSVIEVVMESGGQMLTSHVPSRKGLALKVGDTVPAGLLFDDVVYLDD
ncbi:ABC transporter ATP-binding protein [Shinella sp.]|uniref:ABC transporter ATP-binding protein n=1 Tax=Shinella sp. TaxID=1870904 RepID=UPI0025839430|nr:ABC transporter ATP-binding protein [Shinella sp.]MCW5711869.1 ABC transporter ATP-binding protein [Shinella sp.]